MISTLLAGVAAMTLVHQILFIICFSDIFINYMPLIINLFIIIIIIISYYILLYIKIYSIPTATRISALLRARSSAMGAKTVRIIAGLDIVISTSPWRSLFDPVDNVVMDIYDVLFISFLFLVVYLSFKF